MRNRILIGIAILTVALSLGIGGAAAEDYYWLGGTGDWSAPSNWNPYGPPPDQGPWPNPGNTAIITNALGISATAYFTGAGYINNAVNLKRVSIYGSDVGTMTLSISDGSITSMTSHFSIENNGVVNQTGGEVRSGSGMALVVSSGGIYNLELGTINCKGGGDIAGVFNQKGGDVHFWDGLRVDVGGVYNIYAGSLNIDLYMPPSQISGTFNQHGGTVLTQDRTVIGGTYNLSGGTFNVLHRDLTNNGTLNYSGGEIHLSQPTAESISLVNNGTTNLSGNGTRTIDGSVVNNGTFNVTHTTAVYTGRTFTNNGVYDSHHATQYFNDLIVGQNGYLAGKHGDKFFLAGNFINNSTMNNEWNTLMASLDFIEGEDNIHDLYLAGQDFGQTMSGYDNNFSWGVLDITGNSLYLFDGNSMEGGGLYLREILGLDISGNLIANITGLDGLNIYYLSELEENGYLHGLTYNLTGGGHLMPISTPEPITMLLLGSGLVGLVGLRRKYKK